MTWQTRYFKDKPRPADIGYLNRGHDQLKNCVNWWPYWNHLGSSFVDLMQRNRTANPTNFAINRNGLTCSNDNSSGWSYPTIVGGAYTITCDVIHTDTEFAQNVYVFDGGSGSDRLIVALTTDQANDGPGLFDGTAWRTFGLNAIQDGSRNKWAWVVDGSSGSYLYRDGELVVSASCSMGDVTNNRFMSDNDSTGNSPQGYTFKDLRFYNAALPAEQIREIHNNTYAPFERKVWIPPAAVAGTYPDELLTKYSYPTQIRM